MIPNIEKNIKINCYSKRVKIYNIALSNENGSFDFAITKDRTASGLITNLNKRQRVDSIQNVKVWKLDDLLKNEERKVDLIKIDVEGNEAETLKGMCGIIEQFRPTILIECLSEEKYNQVKNYLKKYNYYNCYHIGKENIKEISNEYRNEVNYPNFLFVYKNKHFEVINNSIR